MLSVTDLDFGSPIGEFLMGWFFVAVVCVGLSAVGTVGPTRFGATGTAGFSGGAVGWLAPADRCPDPREIPRPDRRSAARPASVTAAARA